MGSWILNKIKPLFYKLVFAERSVSKLTLSVCLGIFIAFSPFLGLQTWLLFPICWITGLNITVAMTTLYTVSNPLSFVPIICAGYFFGRWLVVDIIHSDVLQQNPEWVQKILKYFAHYVIDLEKVLGGNICLWCYLLGSIILGLIVCVLLYPLIKHLFKSLVIQVHGKDAIL